MTTSTGAVLVGLSGLSDFVQEEEYKGDIIMHVSVRRTYYLYNLCERERRRNSVCSYYKPRFGQLESSGKVPLASRLVETWFTRHFTLAGQRRASEKSLPRSSKRTRIKEQESILSSTCLCTLHARELLVLVVKLLVLLRVVSIELPTAVLFYMLMVWLRGL